MLALDSWYCQLAVHGALSSLMMSKMYFSLLSNGEIMFTKHRIVCPVPRGPLVPGSHQCFLSEEGGWEQSPPSCLQPQEPMELWRITVILSGWWQNHQTGLRHLPSLRQ